MAFARSERPSWLTTAASTQPFDGIKTVVTFSQLKQAMDFLATNVELHRYQSIADACVASEADGDTQPRGTLPSKREYRLAAIERLTERHRELDLRIRYQGREFPESGSEYKVGGHDDGHLHVCFVKLDGEWSLNEIFLCR